MHISEGVLSMPALAAGWALAAAGLGLGLRRLDDSRLVTASFLAAVFFVASLVHVPVGPVSAHLVCNGLLAALLGPAVFPAVCVGLLLQAVLFQYGGLLVLGVNTATMSLGGLICWRIALPWLTSGGRRQAVAAFFVGAGSLGLTALLTAMCLALSGEAFLTAAQALLLAHLPVMLLEGVVTLFAVSFLARVRPELLRGKAGFSGATA